MPGSTHTMATLPWGALGCFGRRTSSGGPRQWTHCGPPAGRLPVLPLANATAGPPAGQQMDHHQVEAGRRGPARPTCQQQS